MFNPRKPKSFKDSFCSLFFTKELESEPEDDVKEDVVLYPFVADIYYNSVNSGVKRDGNPLQTLVFSLAGLELIAEYYHDKYKANISIITEKNVNYANLLRDIRATSVSNVRTAFVIYEKPPSKHVYPLVYIREKGEEAIFLADSLGVERDTSQTIAQQTGIPVYAVRAARQSSQQGCQTDALVLSRDSTGFVGGAYIIPNLLARLKEVGRATKDSANTFSVKLPDELLKTSQINTFTAFHREAVEHSIHKGETLSQFLSRYSDKDVTVFKEDREIKKESVSNYIRVKGLKMGEIMEEAFYVRQFKRHLKNDWNDQLRREFIARARADKSASLYTLAENFLNEKMNLHSKIEIVIQK